MKAVLFLGIVCALHFASASGVKETEGNDLSNSVAGSQLLNRNIRDAEQKKDGGNKSNNKKSLKRKPKLGKKPKASKKPKNKKQKSEKKAKASKKQKNKKQKSKKPKSKKPKSKKPKSKKPKSKKPKNKKPKNKKAKNKKPKSNKDGGKKGKNLKSARQTCDLTCVTKAVALYVKWSNNLMQNKRISNFVKMSQNKKSKATDFDNSSEILLAYTSGGKDCDGKAPADDIKDAISALPNCSKTAAALCDVKLETADNAKIEKCRPLLEAYISGFAKCYQASAPTCACFNGLPTVDADCDKHLEINNKMKVLKDKCISGSEKGSFSACRKLQLNLGPAIKKCKPPPMMTTKAPAGRFRNINLFKFKQFNKN